MLLRRGHFPSWVLGARGTARRHDSDGQVRRILRTGLYEDGASGEKLTGIYLQTLERLKLLPAAFHYRQQMEATLRRRINLLEGLERPKDEGREKEMGKATKQTMLVRLEEEFGEGRLEEMAEQAQEELLLVEQMVNWKPWEDLECPPPTGQWNGSNAQGQTS